jgi:hypothetical protein
MITRQSFKRWLVAGCVLIWSTLPLMAGCSGPGAPPVAEVEAPPPPPPPPQATSALGAVDSILNQLQLGNIAFNAPDTLTSVDDIANVTLFLSRILNRQALQQMIDDATHTRGEAETASIKISSRMAARLTGQDFTITATSPEVQAVSETQVTAWKWDVKPAREGNLKLHLTLAALLEVQGHDTPRVVQTFDKTIDVKVGPAQHVKTFIQGNWQWLWTTLLVPVGGWIWSRRRKGGKRKKQHGSG